MSLSHSKGLIPFSIQSVLTLMGAFVLLAGCDTDTDKEANEAPPGSHLENAASEADEPRGPQISYVNSTGYGDSLLIGWEGVADANMYALTKIDGPVAQLLWISGTEFLDAQLSPSRSQTYFLQSNFVTGELSQSGLGVNVQNNRSLVARLNTSLRSARSRAEVKSIVQFFMARYFDRIFVGKDGVGLRFNDRALLFSFFAAHNFAPYANSQKFELMDLLQEPTLDCDNYVVLTALLFELITEDTRANSLEFYGFDGGPVGNHAQLIYTPESANEVWLVDPTVGLLVRFGSTEELFAGATPGRISDYYAYYESDLQPPDMIDYMKRIKGAINSGGYRRDQIIYRYVALADYVKYHFMQRSERIE